MARDCLSSAASEVGGVELLPAAGEADENCDTDNDNGGGEDNTQTLHVALKNEWKLFRGERLAKLRGTGENKLATANLRGPCGDVANHGVEEGGLRAGDDESTANTLPD